MASVDTSKLQLKSIRQQDEIQYDPHLQEEKCRADSGQPSSVAITTKGTDDKIYVDVIGKLQDPGKEVPLLTVVRTPGNGQIVTGTAPIKEIEEIRGNDNVISLKAATELYLHLYHSVPAIHCDPISLDAAQTAEGQSFPGLDGSGVVVGVVDFGCDFRHKNFRQSSGATRIRFLWDQSKESKDVRPPEGYGYGREFTDGMINNALQEGEPQAYDKLGYVPAIAAHGTHVMDIAAGNGREPALFGGRQSAGPVGTSHPGVAPNAVLVFVQLKTFDGGFLGNSRHLLEAVEYIFRKADALNMPAVVNLSLSASGGPHDGTTLVEQGFDALVREKPGRAIVVSAGNSFTRQSHLSGAVTKGEPMTILWRTDPKHVDPDTTKNEMEIWYPKGKELTVTLITPDDKLLDPVQLGETKDLHERGAKQRLGRISHRRDDPNNNDNQIDIRLPHLENVPGAWQIVLSTDKGEVEIHAWIEQDDRGLSRFEGTTDSRYTLGSISCSEATLTVGAFDTAEMACFAPPFEATASGPTRRVRREDADTKIDKPDLSAPGVSIVAARAQGGVINMSGTSMAAAHVSGLVALLFQLALRSGRGLLPFSQTRAVLLDAARNNSGPSVLLPARLGAGRADGIGAVKALLEAKAQRPDSIPPLDPDSPDPGSRAGRSGMEKRMKEMSIQLDKVSREVAWIMQMVGELVDNEHPSIPPAIVSKQSAEGRRNGKAHGTNGRK